MLVPQVSSPLLGLKVLGKRGSVRAGLFGWTPRKTVVHLKGKEMLTTVNRMLLCRKMTEIEADEFEFVKEVPKREKSRLRKIWDHFVDIKAVVSEHGMIIPVKLAADIAGVSRQRIHQLFEQGLLERVEFHGHPFVAEKSFVAWARSERVAGRHVDLPKTVSEKWRVGHGRPRDGSKPPKKG